MALVVALAAVSIDEFTETDRGILGRALVDLQARGFSIVEVKAMLSRLRRRLSVNK